VRLLSSSHVWGNQYCPLFSSSSTDLCRPDHKVLPGCVCRRGGVRTVSSLGSDFQDVSLTFNYYWLASSDLINTCRWSPLMFKSATICRVNVWMIIGGMISIIRVGWKWSSMVQVQSFNLYK
jgi:hypothetical protein